MAAADGATDTPLGALRTLGRTLTEVLRVRGSLFAVELREELERGRRLLVLAALAFSLAHLALLLLTLLAVAAFWETDRLAAIGLAAAAHVALAAGAFLRLRHELAAHPAPFAASLEELDRDLATGRSA